MHVPYHPCTRETYMKGKDDKNVINLLANIFPNGLVVAAGTTIQTVRIEWTWTAFQRPKSCRCCPCRNKKKAIIKIHPCYSSTYSDSVCR